MTTTLELERTGTTVREALREYRLANGIPLDGGASEKIAKVKLWRFTLDFPTFPARARAIARHDMHHLLLGKDSSLAGEAVVGGFEVGSGCGPYWVAWVLEPQTITWGLLICPRTTWRAFLTGRRSTNFYTGSLAPEDALDLPIDELRARLLYRGELRGSLRDAISIAAWAVFGLALSAPTIGIALLTTALRSFRR